MIQTCPTYSLNTRLQMINGSLLCCSTLNILRLRLSLCKCQFFSFLMPDDTKSIFSVKKIDGNRTVR
ncbi:hypothetical protein BDF20DRAFT_867401 [Mycotypha africana]|uniref:uncharacterized protein n=1 Tax=Mycotypha africana TaxID=64632 RepID=UPI0023004EC9|nr:uncharacterized protein BDF20DRAFT_867401 [Mycotypha africana]KAI8979057.1 hypothetical protein BDF20DRAFT_867401 [Mycotypha africana]